MRSPFAFAALFLSLTACTSNKPTPVGTITPTEAFGMVRNDFGLLVDVREPNETREGVAQKALLFPKSKLDAEPGEWDHFLKALPKDKEIILYCGSGRRAQAVGERLSAAGYKVKNMGGFGDWQKAGLPVSQPSGV